mmetsp:Transcript_19387/g.35224  ORF Transcript_19387/g.35224 Transcript_19387/m.35224 type:complete len:99 (+) Transcript_19387:652-948(+)
MDEEEGLKVGAQDGLGDGTVDWDGELVRRLRGLLRRPFRGLRGLRVLCGLRSRVASVGTYHARNKMMANVAAITCLMFDTLFSPVRDDNQVHFRIALD